MKKKKKLSPEERRAKVKKNSQPDPYDSPIFVCIVIFLSILTGIVFLFSNKSNESVTREEAIFYEGYFEDYSYFSKYADLKITGHDDILSIFPHTQSDEFIERMESLSAEDKLRIAVHPKSGYVIEIIANESEEILNFYDSQTDIYNYSKGYVWIGAAELVGAVLISIFLIVHYKRKKNKAERIRLHGDKESIFNTTYIRYANSETKHRILLKHTTADLNIIYRRVGKVNELVVNGKVYAEYKALIEFEHKLRANVGGHLIEAGLDKENRSYLEIDGKLVEYKLRVV